MQLVMDRRPIEVLVVEDNPGDVRLLREAFLEAGTRNRIRVAVDGEEAVRLLQQSGTGLPDVILLDLNLPRKGGREVLAEIKADPRLRHIPVVVLSSSSAQEDVAAAYDLRANCYVTKPADLDRYIAVARAIESFWFATARLPPQAALA